MRDLFKKYLDDQCSPGEVWQLFEYFKLPENELALRALIVESLENSNANDNDVQWQLSADKVFVILKNQIADERVKPLPIYQKTWFRVAAAVIVLFGGMAVYNLIRKTSYTEPETVKNSSNNKEILPGSNKAILKLADGSEIILETAENGTLAQQGNTKIVRQADGQLAYNILNEKPTEVFFNSVTTPRGGQYQLTLSDGTKLWLNAASSLRFPVAFTGSERVVELTGEAYFEVAKNKSLPFKVKMPGKAEVEVLGTHFSIHAYRDEPTINTTLLEGSVKVSGLVSDKSRVIVPGEQVILNAKGQMEVNKLADAEQVIAWKNGAFSFYPADLEMSLRQIARWYDVDIVFEGPIPQKNFEGEMQRTLKLSQVIKLLEKSGVYCRIEGKKIIVKA